MVGRKIENLFPVGDSKILEECILRVEHLTISHPHFKDRHIVEDVTFSLRKGEILGLAGLVGSGRSELMNALYGRTAYRGRIFIENKEVKISSPRVAKQHGIGFVTEERKREGLLFNFGIRENVTLNNLSAISRFGILNKALENHTARDFMTRLAIRAPSSSTLVVHLSGGNQQKVVLAKPCSLAPEFCSWTTRPKAWTWAPSTKSTS